MAFNINGTRLLLRAKKMGVNFERVAMIGRQGLYLPAAGLQRNLDDYGFGNASARQLLEEGEGYAEPFLRLLGAHSIDSFDASAYEGATVIHDMNTAIPEQYKSRYTVVIDGGSLEHVFNFPVAMKNCMELLEEGGHYLGLSPTNNYWGHGFYQFSPELYFRIFSESNGFAVEEILFFRDKKGREDFRPSTFYELKDPAVARRRIELINCYGSLLFVNARKVAQREIFRSFPQQSDYEQLSWKKERARKRKEQENGLFRTLRKWIPDPLKAFRRKWILLSRPFGNGRKHFFKPVKENLS